MPTQKPLQYHLDPSRLIQRMTAVTAIWLNTEFFALLTSKDTMYHNF
jgi:hypothetical protein